MHPLRLVACVAALPIATSGVSAVAGATGTGGAPKGKPITVMTIGDFGSPDGAEDTGRPGAVRARFDAVNARGGIADADGVRHRVEVVACNTNFDGEVAAACAQRAVDDDVAAVVGMSTLNSDRVWPILAAAGIPVFGPVVSTAGDATSPVSFPLGSGAAGLFSAMPQVLADDGAERVGVIVSDFGPATDGVVGLVRTGVFLTEATEGPIVRVPPGARDLDPFVAIGTGGDVDGVVSFLPGQDSVRLLEGLGASGYAGAHVMQASIVTDRLVDAAGSDADGTFVVGQFAPLSSGVPGIRMFRTDMLEYDSGLPFTEGAVGFWLAAWVFERVARDLDTIDAASVLQAAGRLEHLDMGGVTPPLRTDVDGGDLPLPRLFNPTVTFSEVTGRAVEWIEPRFFDPFAGRFVRATRRG